MKQYKFLKALGKEFNQPDKESFGFTLIELLVVIAIIGILAAIALVNTGKNPDRDARLERDRLVTYLRDIENKSLAISMVSSATGRICGFGIHYISDTEIKAYFLQTSGASPLDADCGSVSVGYPSSGSQDLDGSNSFFLGHGMMFSETFPDTAFIAPSGEVSVNGTTPPVKIKIEDSSSSITPIETTINKSGLIQ